MLPFGFSINPFDVAIGHARAPQTLQQRSNNRGQPEECELNPAHQPVWRLLAPVTAQVPLASAGPYIAKPAGKFM